MSTPETKIEEVKEPNQSNDIATLLKELSDRMTKVEEQQIAVVKSVAGFRVIMDGVRTVFGTLASSLGQSNPMQMMKDLEESGKDIKDIKQYVAFLYTKWVEEHQRTQNKVP